MVLWALDFFFHFIVNTKKNYVKFRRVNYDQYLKEVPVKITRKFKNKHCLIPNKIFNIFLWTRYLRFWISFVSRSKSQPLLIPKTKSYLRRIFNHTPMLLINIIEYFDAVYRESFIYQVTMCVCCVRKSFSGVMTVIACAARNVMRCVI